MPDIYLAGDLDRILYGNAAGDWCIVTQPYAGGVMQAPPWFGTLRYLSSADDVVSTLSRAIRESRGGRYPAQAALARLAGVSQQRISRFATQQQRASFRPAGWRRVAALLYAWTEWPGKPADLAAVSAFLDAPENAGKLVQATHEMEK